MLIERRVSFVDPLFSRHIVSSLLEAYRDYYYCLIANASKCKIICRLHLHCCCVTGLNCCRIQNCLCSLLYNTNTMSQIVAHQHLHVSIHPKNIRNCICFFIHRSHCTLDTRSCVHPTQTSSTHPTHPSKINSQLEQRTKSPKRRLNLTPRLTMIIIIYSYDYTDRH